MDPTSLSSVELLEMIESLCKQQGGAKALAGVARDTSSRGRYWAMVRDIDERLPKHMIELYRRLGVAVPAEIINRPAFIFLALSRHNRLCEQCNESGGIKSRFLNWVTQDGTPLPLVQATNGASKEEVQAAVKTCRLLCRKCAMQLGTKFLKSGKPDLSEWR